LSPYIRIDITWRKATDILTITFIILINSFFIPSTIPNTNSSIIRLKNIWHQSGIISNADSVIKQCILYSCSCALHLCNYCSDINLLQFPFAHTPAIIAAKHGAIIVYWVLCTWFVGHLWVLVTWTVCLVILYRNTMLGNKGSVK
jgi:hypothetical protein